MTRHVAWMMFTDDLLKAPVTISRAEENIKQVIILACMQFKCYWFHWKVLLKTCEYNADWILVTKHSAACGSTGTPCSLMRQQYFLISYFWYFVKLKIFSVAVFFTLWPLIGSHLNMSSNNLCKLLIARTGIIVYVCNLKTVTWPQHYTSQVAKHKDGWEGETK
jgi:hypothetical protein